MNTNGNDVTDVPDHHDDGGPRTTRVLLASFGQEGIELQHQLAGGSPIFNVPAALELTGKLDRGALHRGLSEIVRRHDVLRTTFEPQGGVLTRIVHAPGEVDLRIRDLRVLPVDARAAEAKKLLDAESATPFDLQEETGIRFLVVVLADNRHVFFWNMHHIVCDGWSKSVFATELSELYSAFVTGRTPDLPELVVDYSDFVEQQRRIEPAVLAEQLTYWDEHLAGVEDLTGVPTDKSRTAAQAPRGEDVDFALSPPTRQGLVALARRHGASLFIVLLAAWASLLHRVSGQQEVVISVPFGSRPSEDFEPLIGFFVNVLALRTDLRGDPSFVDLIERVRDTALEGYENHEVPFQRVADRVQSRRGGRVGSLQQASLAFANLPYQDVRLEGLSIERHALTRVDIRYELELHMWEDGGDGGLGGRLIYRPDLFYAETVSGWVADLCAVLDAVAKDSAVQISDLPVTSRPAGSDEWSWDDDDAIIVQPRTPTEAAVRDIWVGLLHYEDIGVDDNFLDVGGNSFLLALMVSRIRNELGAQLPVRQIMGNPTVEGIAKAVEVANRQDVD